MAKVGYRAGGVEPSYAVNGRREWCDRRGWQRRAERAEHVQQGGREKVDVRGKRMKERRENRKEGRGRE
eukprot:520258-Hanusia_phi.AAC.2